MRRAREHALNETDASCYILVYRAWFPYGLPYGLPCLTILLNLPIVANLVFLFRRTTVDKHGYSMGP